ncbi:hypothetical protein CORC01_03375 [Colletotrichum orchidophilum]|uniref:Small secreted protein n=1 Tax=Colletotrichum orchidophilum TaxID=1209926 RepID=A0A1G4BIS9_9PEZI|nr:uncharacterized protein CORC01_03375 [Colletotrichum orchidophilum]OHF01342.1 hypothetical protein CORC01_03375 [Colletotrichum orchidophilum]
MYFSKIAVLFTLAATGLSAPILGAEKRQAKLLTVQDYSKFQVSSGVGGNALAEVAQKFPVDKIKANLAGVSKDDLATLQAARVAAESAETDAGGFNDSIAKASGADADALKVGKIKNKVLKLQLEVLALQVQQAQGASNQAKIDAEQKKLDNNVKTDTASKGKTSQSVSISATSAPKGSKASKTSKTSKTSKKTKKH